MQKQHPSSRNILQIFAIYGFWVVMFAIQKPIFMLFNFEKETSFGDFLNVIYHGLRLDFCAAAYFVAIPILCFLVYSFVRFPIKRVLNIYHIVLGVLMAIIFAVDCVLFSYWGFRMDSTLIFYLKDISDAASSITLKDVLIFSFVMGLWLAIYLFVYKRITISKENALYPFNTLKDKLINAIITFLLIPVFIIFSRGGVSTATANIGMVYYSTNQYLNLSAINPAFSLFSSLSKSEDFSKQYQYIPHSEAQAIFESLYYTDENITDTLLTTTQPDVLVILLESFSKNVQQTENLNKIAEQGIDFTNCYANAMRTDRGIVSTLSGFLAQPTMSIIKYPEKSRTLYSMAKYFYSKGYSTSMLYGGDINFANMRSYFVSSMYENITSISDFPLKHRLSKWGVYDEETFAYLLEDIQKQDPKQHYFKTFLTLSSHEPFDVNMHKYSHKYVNSVAYTDSCLGVFIDKLQTLPQWDNLLVILVADHGYAYPDGTKEFQKEKYHIPMVWTGGAVRKPMKVEKYINQTDIIATLLCQMGFKPKDLPYSRNIFSPLYKDFAFYVYNNGFGFLDKKSYTIFDCNGDKRIYGDEANVLKGKSILQVLYRDIEKR